MLVDKMHLFQGIWNKCCMKLCMTERLGFGVEKLSNHSMGSFSDTAAPVIERIFGLQNKFKFEWC